LQLASISAARAPKRLVTIDGQVCGEASAATADDDSLPKVLARYEEMIAT